MALERALGIKTRSVLLPNAAAWLTTMVIVMVGWVMFRSETIAHAVTMYSGMLGVHGVALTPETLLLMRSSEVLFLVLGCLLSVLPAASSTVLRRHRYAFRRPLSGLVATGGPILLFVLCAAALHARSESPFLYFQF
jgi:alginate O-acetyltransferase complex protein AlgI